jgi:hypothetical protein
MDWVKTPKDRERWEITPESMVKIDEMGEVSREVLKLGIFV